MPKIYGYTEILGDIVVTGSFSVLGSASTINTTNLVVSDTIISLGHSQSGSPILDEGIMFGRGTGLTQAFIWDESDDTFALVSTNNNHTVVGDININSYSNLIVGGLTTSTVKITNGASNGFILSSNVDGVGYWTASTRDISFGHSSTTPTTSTTYHIGFLPSLAATTTNVVSRRVRSPYRGEITSISIMWTMTVNGSSESVTYQIHNITQATSATITSTAQLTGDAQNTYTLVSPLAVSENDDLQIRWLTPAWVTSPTAVNHVITARIRVY